jgi:hypothetical protein
MPNHGNPANAVFRRLKPNELYFDPAAFLAQSVVIGLVHSTILPTSADSRRAITNKVKMCFRLWRRVEDDRGYFATGSVVILL